jgi:hypothetical protein
MIGMGMTGIEGIGWMDYGTDSFITIDDVTIVWDIELLGDISIPLSGFAFGTQAVPHTQSVQEFWVSDQTERLKPTEITYFFHDVLQSKIDDFKAMLWRHKGKVYQIITDTQWLFGYIIDNQIIERDNCGGEIHFTFLKVREQDIPDPGS